MIKRFLKRLIARNKEFILSRVLAVKDLIRLLMKNRNTGEKGTREESACSFWLRGVDLNHRPLGYEPNELPSCSTPHRGVYGMER